MADDSKFRFRALHPTAQGGTKDENLEIHFEIRRRSALLLNGSRKSSRRPRREKTLPDHHLSPFTERERAFFCPLPYAWRAFAARSRNTITLSSQIIDPTIMVDCATAPRAITGRVLSAGNMHSLAIRRGTSGQDAKISASAKLPAQDLGCISADGRADGALASHPQWRLCGRPVEAMATPHLGRGGGCYPCRCQWS